MKLCNGKIFRVLKQITQEIPEKLKKNQGWTSSRKVVSRIRFLLDKDKKLAHLEVVYPAKSVEMCGTPISLLRGCVQLEIVATHSIASRK